MVVLPEHGSREARGVGTFTQISSVVLCQGNVRKTELRGKVVSRGKQELLSQPLEIVDRPILHKPLVGKGCEGGVTIAKEN